MQSVTLLTRARPGWLPRAIISGFAATSVMLFAFIVAYGIGLAIAAIELADRRGAGVIQSWFHGLTHNQVLDLASTSLYASLAVYFAFGLVWAVAYAAIAEPMLRGPSWLQGMEFSLVPWLLSLVVFFPLVGGGLFGLALGAGPLPILGNLILHLVYGATLGLVYGPFGDIDAERFGTRRGADRAEPDEDAWAMGRSEAMAARGLIIGAALGVLVGLVGATVAQLQPGLTLLGLAPIGFVVASGLLGAAYGGLIGSLVGLPGVPHPQGRG